MVADEGMKLWVRVREVDVGLDPLPNCGRIDIHLSAADVHVEARWLLLLTSQIDKVSSADTPTCHSHFLWKGGGVCSLEGADLLLLHNLLVTVAF